MDVDLVLVKARLTKECKEYQTEHVERRQSCGDDAEAPQQTVRVRAGVGSLEDRVLAAEPGKSRNAANCKSGNEHRPKGSRDFLSQAAHLHHVLPAAHGMDHAARGEEQQAFEKRVGHQMEYASAVGAYAASQEHVAELRDR